jgi:two-component system CheB/CheR fusion protein
MRLGQPASPAPVVAAHLLQRPGGPRPELRFGSARAASWGEMHLKLLEHLGPPSVLVDGRDDIVHVSAHAGRFLQYSAGEPSRNLLRLVLPGLRIELRAALYRATQSGAEVSTGPVRLPGDGGAQQVAVRVVPVRDADLDVKLVLFEASDPVPESPPATAAEGEGEADPLVKQLDHELERMRLHLRDTVDQYEASTHELKASNEELQAINEELRSATEELETSREELQSINEELTTVNQELKSKVDELAHSNADMQNLMDATAIATVFLDRSLAITRYTPSATRLFNLIPGDIGRPLTDLAPLLQYPQLGDDASRVLERLAPIEREVGRDDGSWFLVRLLPYRSAEDRIAGVVLSFINITERKQAEEISQWLSAVVASSMDAIISFSLDGRMLSWNGGAQRIFGYVADEVIGQPIAQLARPGSEADEARLLEAVAAGRHI